MKVAFAVTSFGDVPFEAYHSHIQCLCDWTKRHDIVMAMSYGSTLLSAREDCLRIATEQKCDYILYVDSDVVLPLNALDSLLSCGVDLASGLCIRRGPPFDGIAWIKIKGEMKQPVFDPKQPGVYSVEWVGGGIALFKMSVFDRLEKPYFRHVFENGTQWYEDVYLCKKMREKDMTIVVDSRVQSGHVCRPLTVYPKNAHIFKAMYELLDNTKT